MLVSQEGDTMQIILPMKRECPGTMLNQQVFKHLLLEFEIKHKRQITSKSVEKAIMVNCIAEQSACRKTCPQYRIIWNPISTS